MQMKINLLKIKYKQHIHFSNINEFEVTHTFSYLLEFIKVSII